MTLSSDEQWRPVPGYEGFYEVSDQGRVRSLPRLDCKGRRVRGGILKGTPTAEGYTQVFLRRDNRQRGPKVHQLVMLTFVGPRPEGLEVRHLNGDSTDNRLANLVYGTPSENMRDKRRHGTDYNINKTHCLRGHRLAMPNLALGPLRRGARECLACHRAHSAATTADRAGRSFDFVAYADAAYLQIMATDSAQAGP